MNIYVIKILGIKMYYSLQSEKVDSLAKNVTLYGGLFSGIFKCIIQFCDNSKYIIIYI